jgi:hypothetical protein
MFQPHALPGYYSGRIERKFDDGFLPRGHIDGLVTGNNASDATNDIDVSAGTCRSTSNIGRSGYRSTAPKDQRDIEISDALTKQLDVDWAPGNGGMRHSATAISNASWHMFGIGGRGLKDDVFTYTSADPSLVLPGGYTAWRRVASIIRSGGAIVGYTQFGDHFRRKSAARDVNSTNPATTEQTATLSVPTGIVVLAEIVAMGRNGTGNFYMLTSAFDETNDAAAATAHTLRVESSAGIVAEAAVGYVKTNTSAQIRWRIDSTGGSNVADILTRGWIDHRGRNA